MANIGLTRARANAKDEFYTTFPDIAEELAAYPQAFCNQTVLLPCDAPPSSQFLRYFLFNFKRLGLRKLIATAYVPHGHGTLFLYEREKQPFSQTLAGDGDFRSLEVTKLRDAADIIVTNPPFSLFREFLSWIFQGNKKFLILGNINAVTYKEVFPLFKENQLWLGYTTQLKKKFTVPSDYPLEASRCGKDADGTPYIYVKGITWFTNLAHAKRNQPLPLASMQDNLLHHTKLRKKLLTTYGKLEYPFYDRFNAIECPITSAIPSDYPGIIGVPITFLTKYSPKQFRILGEANHGIDSSYDFFKPTVHGQPVFKRILISHLAPTKG